MQKNNIFQFNENIQFKSQNLKNNNNNSILLKFNNNNNNNQTNLMI